MLIAAAAVLQAQAAPSSAEPPAAPIALWFQQNVLAIAIIVFHFGVSWREFLDHRRRITKLEDEFAHLDKTYARRDVLAAELTAIRNQLREWDRTFSFLKRHSTS